jgi:hypothetical protein
VNWQKLRTFVASPKFGSMMPNELEVMEVMVEVRK